MMAAMWRKVTVVIVMFTVASARHGKHEAYDFTVISYDDLAKDVVLFSAPGVPSYSQLTFDLPRGQLLVGARDYLFRLNISSLQLQESAEWSSTDNQVHMCVQKGQAEDNCHNFIRVLLTHDNRVFSCGTNAFHPVCSWREITSLNKIIEKVEGIGRCPFSPHHNSTALFTVEGDYYGATMLDFTARDPAIYRIMGPSKHLRTAQYNDEWLNDPEFVASFEVGDYTYHFFRETALEYTNCGKVIYSRVARICKKDLGGRLLMENTWTTFIKARINCSLPADIPFYFDQIQDVYFHDEQKRFYAVFTTQRSSIHGSAVCVYDMERLEEAFAGPFKYQHDMNSKWEQVPNKQLQTCDSTKDADFALVDAQMYYLMNNAIQSNLAAPLFFTDMERFTHIAVDNVEISGGPKVDVVFAATSDGLIKKLVKLPHMDKACLVEQLHLFPEKDLQPIHALRYLKLEKSLYVGTDGGVMKVAAERCSRFKSQRDCLNAQDPYCGWYLPTDECTSAPFGNTKVKNWIQDLHACPMTSAPVNGGFGEWSVWRECAHIGLLAMGDACMCRTRECDSPPPANGGITCRGMRVQVSNCTTHGGWTEWSEWSACSQTCGVAIKTRHRRCGNPEPRFGGRVCVGKEREEEFCEKVPCPTPEPLKVNGGWSNWEPWNHCSEPCGGGLRMRTRKCNKPVPRNGGMECPGCDEQFSPCNVEPCGEIKKSTPWTRWGKTNLTKDGYYEERYRFSCHAEVPHASLIRIGHVRKQERFCVEGGRSCLNSAFINTDGQWSPWSEWSKCSARCGGGVQTRQRECNSPRPAGSGDDCEGYGLMQQECNTHSCQGEWSCWSEWSECSVTCNTGTKLRTRECMSHSGKGCRGQSREESICEMAPCKFEVGWDQWSTWSKCDSQNKRHRTRKCLFDNPNSTQCQGISKDSRSCEYVPLQSSESQMSACSGGNILLLHLVIGICAAFFAGCLVSAAVMMCHQRKHKAEPKRESAINKADLFMPVNLEWKNNESANIAATPFKNGSLLHNGTLPRHGTLPRGATITRGPSLTRKQNPYGTLNRLTVKTPEEIESFKRASSLLKNFDSYEC